jgi:hypothetical protein
MFYNGFGSLCFSHAGSRIRIPDPNPNPLHRLNLDQEASNLCDFSGGSFWRVSQVSWTKEVKKARKGESSVSLYDAEGYSALKRSRERGEADSLAPLLTIVVSYPGSYSKMVFMIKFLSF